MTRSRVVIWLNCIMDNLTPALTGYTEETIALSDVMI